MSGKSKITKQFVGMGFMWYPNKANNNKDTKK